VAEVAVLAVEVAADVKVEKLLVVDLIWPGSINES
jgi:hypothetical protein